MLTHMKVKDSTVLKCPDKDHSHNLEFVQTESFIIIINLYTIIYLII